MENSTYYEAPTDFPTDPSAIALPILTALANLLLIVPFVSLYSGNRTNIGACSQITFVMLANLFTFINAILWPNEDYENWWIGTGLCDVEAKLQAPIYTGVASATLCISRELAIALDTNNAKITWTKAAKTRKIVEDVMIVYTIPVLQIVLHYVVQYNRYYVSAIGGCAASYDSSWPTIVVIYVWPPLFALVDLFYSGLIIARLHKHRTNIANILSAGSGNNQTTTAFLRMAFMSFTTILVYLPISIYFFYANVNIPWYSFDWSINHDPSTIDAVVFLPTDKVRTFDHYTGVAFALLIFLYFGFTANAVEMYRAALLRCGFGRMFPSLKERKRPGHDDYSGRGIMSKFSLVGRARSYLDKMRSRNDSADGTGCDWTEASMSSVFTTRKGSLMPAVEQMRSQDQDTIVSMPANINKLSQSHTVLADTPSAAPTSQRSVLSRFNPFHDKQINKYMTQIPETQAFMGKETVGGDIDTQIWSNAGIEAPSPTLFRDRAAATPSTMDQVRIHTRLERMEETLDV